jgi:hypothetical protein
MYIEYIACNFSIAIGIHVYGSWNITKQKQNNTIQCPFIKFPSLLYGSSFFPVMKKI